MPFFRCILSLAIAIPAFLISIGPAAAAVNVPPSARLDYTIKARQSGIILAGRARVHWQAGGGKYSASAETTAMLLGKILNERSEGTINANGLVPAAYTEKRFRKPPTTTRFDRRARLIRFGEGEQTRPLQGGEQDRASAIWQLIALARAEKRAIKPGTSWRFLVAGQRDADPWTFIVEARERIKTPLGELDTVHILRAPPADAKSRRLDIWLAPSLEWFPVQLRFEEGEGEYVEQFIEAISRP